MVNRIVKFFTSLKLTVVLLGAGLLLFQAAALQHNLQMWRTVPVLARNACTSIGTELARDPRPVEVRNLPIKHQGVWNP